MSKQKGDFQLGTGRTLIARPPESRKEFADPTALTRQILDTERRGRPATIRRANDLAEIVGFRPQAPGRHAIIYVRDKLGCLYELFWDDDADSLTLEMALEAIPTRHIEAAMLCQYPHAHDGSAIGHEHPHDINPQDEGEGDL